VSSSDGTSTEFRRFEEIKMTIHDMTIALNELQSGRPPRRLARFSLIGYSSKLRWRR
jgi:hypothetical protein